MKTDLDRRARFCDTPPPYLPPPFGESEHCMWADPKLPRSGVIACAGVLCVAGFAFAADGTTTPRSTAGRWSTATTVPPIKRSMAAVAPTGERHAAADAELAAADGHKHEELFQPRRQLVFIE